MMGVFIHFGWFVTEGKGKSRKATCRNSEIEYVIHAASLVQNSLRLFS